MGCLLYSAVLASPNECMAPTSTGGGAILTIGGSLTAASGTYTNNTCLNSLGGALLLVGTVTQYTASPLLFSRNKAWTLGGAVRHVV